MSQYLQNIQSVTILWVNEHGFRVLVIVVIAFLVHRFARFFIEGVIRKIIRQGTGTYEAEKRREKTLSGAIHGIVGTLVIILAFLFVLSEFGIAIMPVLAALGVAGLAISFGGQYLIRDLISGLFILLENQYRVGDVVCFDATCGSVETVTLRMTTLRDMDGTLHHIPHGEVKKVSNLSKKFARVNLNIQISYTENLERVIQIINQIGTDMAKDPIWKEKIISAPKFLRIDEFSEYGLILKILGDTIPFAQWDVAGELRKRIKTAFDDNNIQMPLPQRVVRTIVD